MLICFFSIHFCVMLNRSYAFKPLPSCHAIIVITNADSIVPNVTTGEPGGSNMETTAKREHNLADYVKTVRITMATVSHESRWLWDQTWSSLHPPSASTRGGSSEHAHHAECYATPLIHPSENNNSNSNSRSTTNAVSLWLSVNLCLSEIPHVAYLLLEDPPKQFKDNHNTLGVVFIWTFSRAVTQAKIRMGLQKETQRVTANTKWAAVTQGCWFDPRAPPS